MELGPAFNGFRTGKKKDPYNFYQTDRKPVVSLCKEYYHILRDLPMLEPACGEGDIVRAYHELIKQPVLAIDIYHRGFGLGGIDFLQLPTSFKWPGAIIMNPPFDYSHEFIEKCLSLEPKFVAMFAKQQFWNVNKRLDLYQRHPPRACRPLSWRVDFTGEGKPTMDCQWVIWGEDVPFSHEPMVRP